MLKCLHWDMFSTLLFSCPVAVFPHFHQITCQKSCLLLSTFLWFHYKSIYLKTIIHITSLCIIEASDDICCVLGATDATKRETGREWKDFHVLVLHILSHGLTWLVGQWVELNLGMKICINNANFIILVLNFRKVVFLARKQTTWCQGLLSYQWTMTTCSTAYMNYSIK